MKRFRSPKRELPADALAPRQDGRQRGGRAAEVVLIELTMVDNMPGEHNARLGGVKVETE